MALVTQMRRNYIVSVVVRFGNFLNNIKTTLLFWLYMMAVMAYARGF